MNAFCFECLAVTDYEVRDKHIYSKVRNITYKGKEAICLKCHHEIHVSWVNEYNINELHLMITVEWEKERINRERTTDSRKRD